MRVLVADEHGAVRRLTPRVAGGDTNKEVAALLHIGVPTVEIHRTRLTQKLNLWRFAGLVFDAARKGLLTTSR